MEHDYKFQWREQRPLHEHPEYEARSKLSAKEFSNWIEGQDRGHPGYEKNRSEAENEWCMGAMDWLKAHTPSRIAIASTAHGMGYTIPEWLHWCFQMARSSRAKFILDEKYTDVPDDKILLMFEFLGEAIGFSIAQFRAQGYPTPHHKEVR